MRSSVSRALAVVLADTLERATHAGQLITAKYDAAPAVTTTAAAPAPEVKKDAPIKKHAKAKRAKHAKKAASAA